MRRAAGCSPHCSTNVPTCNANSTTTEGGAWHGRTTPHAVQPARAVDISIGTLSNLACQAASAAVPMMPGSV